MEAETEIPRAKIATTKQLMDRIQQRLDTGCFGSADAEDTAELLLRFREFQGHTAKAIVDYVRASLEREFPKGGASGLGEATP